MKTWQPRNEAERAAADRAVEFISHLRHTRGVWAGVPFKLLPWQEHGIIRPVFGTLRPDGLRRIRTAWVEVAKKSGKSELAAALALKLLLADDEPMGEVYSAAVDRDQASIVFRLAAQMVRTWPQLAKRCRVLDSTKRILVTAGRSAGSFYQALSADADSADGVSPSGVIFDEVHRQPDRRLWDVLRDSTAARAQPLLFAITTAGSDRESLGWSEHEYARKVAEGIVTDPTYLPVIHTAAPGSDFRDPKAWAAAHPSLGVTVPTEFYEQQSQRAAEEPAYENTFRRFFLCEWVSQSTRWMPMHLWDASAGLALRQGQIADAMRGAACLGGLDLSQTRDLTAFAIVLPPWDDPLSGSYRAFVQCWIPEENVAARSRADRVSYEAWIAQGWVKPTPGNTIDYATIERDIRELSARFNVVEIAFDPMFAWQLAQQLDAAGIAMLPFRQGYATMSPPTATLLQLVRERRFMHHANPLLRWMADSVVVEQDAEGRFRPSKRKSSSRIDGVVASVMALDRAERHVMGAIDHDPASDTVVWDERVNIGPNV
jgi:phage terminase large subunit-like protein